MPVETCFISVSVSKYWTHWDYRQQSNN